MSRIPYRVKVACVDGRITLTVLREGSSAVLASIPLTQADVTLLLRQLRDAAAAERAALMRRIKQDGGLP